MKEPFFLLSGKWLRKLLNRGYNMRELIVYYFKCQWFYFKCLYLKKCNNNKRYDSHFTANGFCLRCKKSLKQLDMEWKLNEINN